MRLVLSDAGGDRGMPAVVKGRELQEARQPSINVRRCHVSRSTVAAQLAHSRIAPHQDIPPVGKGARPEPA